MSEIKTLNGYSLADTKAREDIASLSEEIDDLKIIDYASEMQFGMAAAIYKAAGTVIGAAVASDAFSHFDVECAKGQIFEIKGDANQSVGLWTFVDSNRAVIEHNPYNENSAYDNPVQVTAPDGAARLLVNMKNTHLGYLVRIGDSALALIKKFEDMSGDDVNTDNSQDALADLNGLYEAKDCTHRFVDSKGLLIPAPGSTAPEMTSSSKMKTMEVECSAGDIFEVKACVWGNNSGYRLWGFVDADRVVLDRATGNQLDNMYKPVRIVAPEGAAKLIVLNYLTGYDDAYVVKMGKFTAAPPTVVNYNSAEYKYIMPRWAEIEPFEEKVFTNEQNYSGYSFSDIYQAFHALNKAGVIEEINMTTDYLTFNANDTLPEGISSITDGGMYMWHVIPPASDTKNFSPKYKRAKVMLLGGIHGSERKSIWDLYYMLKDIHDGRKSRAVSILSNYFDLYIVPLCCPYAIENVTRANHNGVNLARDFQTSTWAADPEGADVPNSQYETRCISWWFNQIKPEIFVDHHTSTGDNSTERPGEHFLAWGDSRITSINSVIEETIIDMSPEIRAEYPDYFGDYKMVFGFTSDTDTYLYDGLPEFYAYENGAISCLFEVVHTVKWDGVQIIDGSDEKQTVMMTIDYCMWMNFLMRFLRESVDMLNGKVRY